MLLSWYKLNSTDDKRLPPQELYVATNLLSFICDSLIGDPVSRRHQLELL